MRTDDPVERPLHDLRVIEFEALGPGPLAGRMLSDLGAHVTVVARPTTSPVDRVLIGENTENPLRRGKEIITLDLKAANGVIAALDLIADADALIEGNRPGVMERLGLGPPYDFTANSALEISSRISSLPAGLGLVTPSLAFGADFVLSLPGCFRTDIPSCGTDLPRQSQ